MLDKIYMFLGFNFKRIMEKRSIQEKILRKLMAMKPPRWRGSHTEETNLVKGLPSHLRGEKIVEKAIKELYQREFLLKSKKTGERYVSLNPQKRKEIYRFLGLPPN
jgi:hypothetical protein